MRSFVKIKPSRNGGITLSFIDGGKSCLSREFSMSQICLLMLFAKIKFSRKFPNLQYITLAIEYLVLDKYMVYTQMQHEHHMGPDTRNPDFVACAI